MLTTSDSGIRQALLETAQWCRTQPLTAEPFESEQVRRQRALWDQSSVLDWESYRKTGRLSKKAEKLRKQVDFQSLILLGHQLRGPSLKPSIELTYPAGNPEWELAVNELIGKRRELLTSQEWRLSISAPSRKASFSSTCLETIWLMVRRSTHRTASSTRITLHPGIHGSIIQVASSLPLCRRS